MQNSPSILLLSRTRLCWEPFLLKEADQDIDHRLKYFQKRPQKASIISKIVQISDKKVFIIGGMNKYCSLLTYRYEVGRSCLEVDLGTWTVREKAKMIIGRYDHGIGHV
jgi:hypothetical protein